MYVNFWHTRRKSQIISCVIYPGRSHHQYKGCGFVCQFFHLKYKFIFVHTRKEVSHCFDYVIFRSLVSSMLEFVLSPTITSAILRIDFLYTRRKGHALHLLRILPRPFMPACNQHARIIHISTAHFSLLGRVTLYALPTPPPTPLRSSFWVYLFTCKLGNFYASLSTQVNTVGVRQCYVWGVP